jgi:uncharacterized membrane protein YqiK
MVETKELVMVAVITLLVILLVRYYWNRRCSRGLFHKWSKWGKPRRGERGTGQVSFGSPVLSPIWVQSRYCEKCRKIEARIISDGVPDGR